MMTDTVMRGRRIVFTIVALLMLAALSATSAGEVRAQAPTVGDIVVDSYDCDTGALRFRVAVTGLPSLPDGDSLGYSATGRYALGPDFSVPVNAFNPQSEVSPYTGEVALTLTVPPSNRNPDLPGPSGALATIDISVFVGLGDGTGPSDTSTLTYAVDCGDEGDIVDQLIAILVRILQDILGE